MIIRKTNMKNLTKDGIPQDSQDVMEYFNKDLEIGKLPKWIPRKTLITTNEIKNLWMPTMEKNITFLAEDNGKIIGSLTVFYDTNSTGYENKNTRKIGSLNATINSKYDYKKISKLLIEKTIEELKNTNQKAHVKGAKESPIKEIFEELGYKLTKGLSKIQKTNGLSGETYECDLP